MKNQIINIEVTLKMTKKVIENYLGVNLTDEEWEIFQNEDNRIDDYLHEELQSNPEVIKGFLESFVEDFLPSHLNIVE
ncbi:hypothetical protein EB821_04710 [Candidatus Marinimicrobia bacterium PRS2]|nr:hypothetical protein EB821_04710 [Candidatus Marinimicrobia bacterium PRS2]